MTVAVTALVSAAAAIGAVAASAAPAPASPSPTISRSAAIAYPGCPAGAVTLTLKVPRDPVPAGIPVRYTVSLHNRTATCGPAQVPVARPNAPVLMGTLFGPCGQLSLTIRNRSGEQVSPPFEAISCPALLGPRLLGRTTLTVARTWNQLVGGGGRPARQAQPAPRGTYRVFAGDKLSAPFVLAPRRSSTATRTPGGRSASGMVTRRGHVAFEGCPANQLVATVSVPARSHVGALVTYVVRLTNVGTTQCGPSASVGPPGPPMLTVGVCGLLPAVVHNAAGINIFPGRVVFPCPMERFVDIPAHTSVTAMGKWPGAQQWLGRGPVQVSAAPPGRYRIVVGAGSSVVSVPFMLVAAPAATPSRDG